MIRNVFVISCLSLLISLSAYANEKSISISEEEAVIQLCPALSKDNTYAKDKAFKSMIAGSDGWIFRTVMDLKSDFEISKWSSASFGRLQDAFKYRGTDLSVIMIPTRGIVGYGRLLPPYSKSYDHVSAKNGYERLLFDLHTAGLIVADTRNVDTVPDFFLKRDNHWTAEGARYSAQQMAKAIKASPVYLTLRKEEFETSEAAPGEDDEANDRFLSFIKKICKKKPPLEVLPAIYSTSPKDVSASALLGESIQPEVTLLGTSNSTALEPSYANFAGFLKEYLSVDIKNEATSGGAFRGSIANYVLTGRYDSSIPKLIIWELSAHYGFSQKDTFREIIPALYGVCSDEDALAMTRGTLKAGQNVIFDNLSALEMSSYDYYLYLKMENNKLRKFKVEFLHDKDKKDIFKFKRSSKNFPEHMGMFFAELKHGISQPLISVSLKAKEYSSGAYTAKICRVPELFTKRQKSSDL